MSKPVQVFILLGQSNMVGLGKIKGGDISLEHAVKTKKKYQYLVDDAGAWLERKDVRFVRYMSNKGPLNNEFLTVKGNTLGPEFGLGHPLGNAIEALDQEHRQLPIASNLLNLSVTGFARSVYAG